MIAIAAIKQLATMKKCSPAIGLASSNFDNSLGTIGGGNHFAELQRLQSIVEPSLFEGMDLSKDSLYLLVHSGSRGLGEHILRGHQKHFGNGALKANSKEGEYYLSQHNDAVKWAKLNREIIATKFMLHCDQRQAHSWKLCACHTRCQCHNCVATIQKQQALAAPQGCRTIGSRPCNYSRLTRHSQLSSYGSAANKLKI
jgi:RNA-splicing ligase RtcB